MGVMEAVRTVAAASVDHSIFCSSSVPVVQADLFARPKHQIRFLRSDSIAAGQSHAMAFRVREERGERFSHRATAR